MSYWPSERKHRGLEKLPSCLEGVGLGIAVESLEGDKDLAWVCIHLPLPPAAAVGDTLERQLQRWPWSFLGLKVPNCRDSFPEAEHAGGDQQGSVEMKPLLFPQEHDGTCMHMSRLAAFRLALPAFLPAQSQEVHRWPGLSKAELQALHSTRQCHLGRGHRQSRMVTGTCHSSPFSSFMNGGELNSQVWTDARCYCCLCELKTSWKYWRARADCTCASHTCTESPSGRGKQQGTACKWHTDLECLKKLCPTLSWGNGDRNDSHERIVMHSPQPSQAMCGTEALPFSPLQHTSLTKSRTEPFGSDWSWSEHVFLFFSFPLLHPLENVDISAKGWKPKPWIFSIGKRWGKGRGIIPKLPTIKSLLLLRLLGFCKGGIFGGQWTLLMKISVLSKPNFSLEVFQLASFLLVMVWTTLYI